MDTAKFKHTKCVLKISNHKFKIILSTQFLPVIYNTSGLVLAKEEQRMLSLKPCSPTLLFAMHQAMPGNDLKKEFMFWVHPLA